MPIVAIAGGTSPSLGRSLVLGVLEQHPDGKWAPLILSRSNKRPLWLQAIDPDATRVKVAAVDYALQSSIAAQLKVAHTLISVATDLKDQPGLQIRLLDAACDAELKRFVPSYWAVGINGWKRMELLNATMEGVWEACLDRERQGFIRVAQFNHGLHMNHLGVGAKPVLDGSDVKKLQLYTKGKGWAEGDDAVSQGVDKTADMPDGSGCFLWSPAAALAELLVKDDGRYPMLTMTLISDVGRFVGAVLDAGWKHNMTIAGETICVDKVSRLVEAAIGRKLDTTTLTAEQLREERANLKMPEQSIKGLWVDLKLLILREKEDEIVLHGSVNKLCPHIKPTRLEEYLKQSWSSQ